MNISGFLNFTEVQSLTPNFQHEKYMYATYSAGSYCISLVKTTFTRYKRKKPLVLIKATLEVVITCILDDLHLLNSEISSCYITKIKLKYESGLEM